MRKRIFFPIWDMEKMETKLEEMEQQGWRLDDLFGMHGFEFTSAQPKQTQYILTYQITRGPWMYDLEYEIKSKLNANIIGKEFHVMRQIKVFRITQPCDLQEARQWRNQEMCRMMRFNAGMCLLSLLLLLSLFLLVLEAWPLVILFGALLAMSVAGLAYYLIAWWIFKRKTSSRAT